MPDDPRLTIPVLLGTIRAGRRSAHVALLPLGQLEGFDEVVIVLIDLADLDIPVMRHRLGETDAASPRCRRAEREVESRRRPRDRRAGVQKRLPEFPQQCVRLSPSGHSAAQAHRHRHGVIGRDRRSQLPRPVAAGLPGHGGVPIPVALPVSRVDEAFDEPGTLRGPKLAAHVRPSIGELNWYLRALASPRGWSVESGSPGMEGRRLC